jgi:hypothetical protein
MYVCLFLLCARLESTFRFVAVPIRVIRQHSPVGMLFNITRHFFWGTPCRNGFCNSSHFDTVSHRRSRLVIAGSAVSNTLALPLDLNRLWEYSDSTSWGKVFLSPSPSSPMERKMANLFVAILGTGVFKLFDRKIAQ